MILTVYACCSPDALCRNEKPQPVNNIPPRPRARRSNSSTSPDPNGAPPFQDDQEEDDGVGNGPLGGWSVSGFGLIPTLLGINFVSAVDHCPQCHSVLTASFHMLLSNLQIQVHNHGGNQNQQQRAPQTARQDNQDFVSRLLLFFGVMVIVMLLLI
jgi:hypothetical protein